MVGIGFDEYYVFFYDFIVRIFEFYGKGGGFVGGIVSVVGVYFVEFGFVCFYVVVVRKFEFDRFGDFGGTDVFFVFLRK